MSFCGVEKPPLTEGWDVSSQARASSPASAATMTTGSSRRPMVETDEASDVYIANALKNMSIKERDELYHELHGVADMIEETPALLAESFQKLKKELSVQSSKTFVGGLNCRPFQSAEEQNYHYVHSEFLYKAFLRSERFDVKAAAKRMIRFYEYKLKSFGEESLCKDITQKLLSEQDLKIYRNGFSQALPSRDAIGRAICVLFPTLTAGFGTPARMGRVIMYQNWSVIQDEETQRRGCACVIIANPRGGHEYSTKSSTMMDIEMIAMASQAAMSLPLRIAVIHNCFSDSNWKSVMKLGMQLVSRDIRARNKVHFGASMECSYSLMGFGIPPACLPISMHGDVKTKQHIEFIKMRKKQEEMTVQGKLIPLSKGKDAGQDTLTDPKTVIVIPALSDILLGRGKPIHSHPGNIWLHQLVDEAIPRYEKCRKLEKTGLTIELVNKVKENNGRFLKQEPSGVWLVTDDEASRNKVSHLFRARRGPVLEVMARQREQQQAHQRTAQISDAPPAGKRSKFDHV